VVEDQNGCITISATYFLPKHTIKVEQYIDFFKIFGNHFIDAGDYNAKHMHWGSRLILPKEAELLKAIEAMTLVTLFSSNSEIHIECSPAIKEEVAEKRKLRKLRQTNRCPVLKNKLNHAIKALKKLS